MQIQSINTYNNQIGFGAIYQPNDANFNKTQKTIVNSIKKTMREPLQEFNGETAEGFYKSKGFDFEIVPYSSESVSLMAYKGMKENGIGVDREYTYLDRVSIGKYDKKSEFKVSDIKTGIKNNNRKYLGFIVGTLTAIFSVFLMITNSPKQKMQETTKPLIENVDSAANKAKVALPDTPGVNKLVNTKVLKAIK